MKLERALSFARDRRNAVLTTLGREGRPQLSNIFFVPLGDALAISVTDGRIKTQNLRRDPRASLYVPGDDFWHWVVLEALAELSPVAQAPDDPVVEDLVALYRTGQGEHENWDEFRQAMVNDERLVVRLRPNHAYGMLGS
jgi:PPOX class probable F420-dependent enzyme